MSIDQRSLTTGEVEGSGLFDELMRTVKSHVHEERAEGRIMGESYTQVYLGSLQGALQAALQYTLQYQLTNKQLLIADEQIKQNQKQNELLELQKEQLRLANETAQYHLTNTLPLQTTQLGLQNGQITAQTSLVNGQLTQVTAQTALTGKQEDLVDEQITSAKHKHTDPIAGLDKKAFDKVTAEIDILTQKGLTEKAQTEGTYIGAKDDQGNPIAGAALGGLVGAEMSLKDIQKDSFLRDAEQKAAKMYTDVFATLYATDPDDAYVMPENYGFDIATARGVIDKMLSGVDVTRSTDDVIPSGAAGISVPEVKTDANATFTAIKYPRKLDNTTT